jgi:long-chain acyl-CoA synthetase
VSVSGPELGSEVTALAASLIAYGARPGDPMAVISDDELEIWTGELAVLAGGGCCVTVDPTAERTALLRALKGSGARFALVSSAPVLARLLAVRPELPDLEMVLLFREPTEGGALPATLVRAARSLGADSLSADPHLLERARSEVRGHDTAYLLSIAGREADHQVVGLSHDNLISATRALAETFPLEADDRALSRLPVLQVARRPWHAALVSRGATLVFGEPETAAQDQLEALRPTLILGEGKDLEDLLRQLVRRAIGRSPVSRLLMAWARSRALKAARPDLADARLPARPPKGATLGGRLVLDRIHAAAGGRLRWIVSVDQPLGGRSVISWLGTGLAVLEGIGTASTSGVLCQNSPSAFRPGSAGRPLPGAGLRVDDDGQIWVRGPIVEHARSPGSDRRVADRSWFRTGLIGSQDDDGYVTVV